MGDMRMLPVNVTREQLLGVLADMINLVAVNDSFEGSLTYSLPWRREFGDPLKEDEPDDNPQSFRLQASYRIGNSMGQGGIRMIGEMREIDNA